MSLRSGSGVAIVAFGLAACATDGPTAVVDTPLPTGIREVRPTLAASPIEDAFFVLRWDGLVSKVRIEE